MRIHTFRTQQIRQATAPPSSSLSAAQTHTDLLHDSEVDYGGLCADLWCVVGVGQLGGDVETELWIILHLFISQLQQHPAAWRRATFIFD